MGQSFDRELGYKFDLVATKIPDAISPSAFSYTESAARQLLRNVGMGMHLGAGLQSEALRASPTCAAFWDDVNSPVNNAEAAICLGLIEPCLGVDAIRVASQIRAEAALVSTADLQPDQGQPTKSNTAIQIHAEDAHQSTLCPNEVPNLSSRKLIRRSDLWKALGIDKSTLNTRINNNGHPKPLNPQDKKNQVFDLEEVNRWLKSNGFPELDC